MNNVRLSTKLYAVVGALSVLSILLVAFAIIATRYISSDLEVATSKTAVKLDLAGSVQAAVWKLEAHQSSIFTNYYFKNAQAAVKDEEQWNQTLAAIKTQFNDIEPLLTTAAGKTAVSKMRADVNAYEPLARDYIRLSREGNFDSTR